MSRSSSGRSFQADGPAMTKARRPYVASRCLGIPPGSYVRHSSSNHGTTLVFAANVRILPRLPSAFCHLRNAVVLHSSRRRSVKTTGQDNARCGLLFCLPSSSSTASSSLYGGQASFPSFRRLHMERASTARRICTVTWSFQIASQKLPAHSSSRHLVP